MFIVYTHSVEAAKRVAKQARVPAPRARDLVDVSPSDPEFRDLDCVKDVLYWADEEELPLVYQAGDRASIDDWIDTGKRVPGERP